MDDEAKLGEFRCAGNETNWSLQVGAMAVSSNKYGASTMYLLSAAGPSTAVKAVAAMLSMKGVRMAARIDDFMVRGDALVADGEDGYQCHKARLGYDTWHLLAVSKSAMLMPNFSERALLEKLMGPRFTTPLLKEWALWITRRLVEEELLDKLKCFQCDAALLSATNDDLDRIVSEGVKMGHLAIRRSDAA